MGVEFRKNELDEIRVANLQNGSIWHQRATQPVSNKSFCPLSGWSIIDRSMWMKLE